MPPPPPVSKCEVGEQPRWVQMPTQTKISGLRERPSFSAYLGVKPGRLDWGSARRASWVLRPAICSGDRWMIQTGLPRHSTVFMVPTGMSPMSTSTGAGGAGFFRRGKRAHKRYCRCDTCYATHSTGGGYPETSRRIGRQIWINRTVIIMHQRILTHLPILVDAPALRVASLLRHRLRGNM